jgi:catechol 2,3-dioxygenase-like lactoylglutathione lyase family enzyme
MLRISRVSIALNLLVAVPCVVMAQVDVVRPRLLRIQSVEVNTTDEKAANEFYGNLTVALGKCGGCGWKSGQDRLVLPTSQVIEVSSKPPAQPSDLVNRVTFEVDDERQLIKYFKAKGVTFIEHEPVLKEEKPYLSVADPEGHAICFAEGESKIASKAQSAQLIHAGWVVKDRAAMDAFYKDILGFHLYWQGGMKDGEVSWVSMQVPDGTDWIEYMLNIPSDASKQLLGVMNHIAIGVPSVAAVAKQLETNGMKLTEQPKIGRDGKWQLNLYDPDLTRVEFMEFAPVEKPCCSEFTGKHPQP